VDPFAVRFAINWLRGGADGVYGAIGVYAGRSCIAAGVISGTGVWGCGCSRATHDFAKQEFTTCSVFD
jgi:hypothetical protein